MPANHAQASSTAATAPPRYVQYAYTVRGGTPLARTWSVAGLPCHRTLLVPIVSIIETLLAPGVSMIDDSRIADVAERVAASSLQTLAGNDRLVYLKWTRERQLAQLQRAASLFRRDVEVGRAKLPTLRVPPHTGGAVALVRIEDVGKVVDAVRRAEPRWSAEGEDALADVPAELRRFNAVHLVDPAARKWATATLGTVFHADPPPPAPAPPALPPTPPAAAAAPRTEPDGDADAPDAADRTSDALASGSAGVPALPPTSPRAMGASHSTTTDRSPRAMTAPTAVLDVLDQRSVPVGSPPPTSIAAAVATPPTWARPAPSISSARSPTPTRAFSAPPPALGVRSPPVPPAVALSAPPAAGLLDDSPVLYVSDDPSPSATGNRWPDVSFPSSSQGAATDGGGSALSPAPAPAIPPFLQSPSPSSFPCPPLGQVAPPSDDTEDDDVIVFPSLPPVRARGPSTPASIAAARRSVPAWIRRLQGENDEDDDSDVEYEGIASTAVSSSDESEAADPMDVDEEFSLTQVVDSISSQPLQMGPLQPVVATPALDAAGALVRMRRSVAIVRQRGADETVGMLAAVDRDRTEVRDECGVADNDADSVGAVEVLPPPDIDAEVATANAPFWSTNTATIAEPDAGAPRQPASLPEPAAETPVADRIQTRAGGDNDAESPLSPLLLGRRRRRHTDDDDDDDAMDVDDPPAEPHKDAEASAKPAPAAKKSAAPKKPCAVRVDVPVRRSARTAMAAAAANAAAAKTVKAAKRTTESTVTAAPAPELPVAAARAVPESSAAASTEADQHAPPQAAAAAQAVADPAVVQVLDSSAALAADGPEPAQQGPVAPSTPWPVPPDGTDAARAPAPSTEPPAAADKLDPAARGPEPQAARDADAPAPRDREMVVVAWDPETTPEPHRADVDVDRNVAVTAAEPPSTAFPTSPVAEPSLDSAIVPSAPTPSTAPADTSADGAVHSPPLLPPVDDARAVAPVRVETDPVSADPRDRIELYCTPTAPAGSTKAQGMQEEGVNVPMDEDEAALEPQAAHVSGEPPSAVETVHEHLGSREDEAPAANGHDAHGTQEDAMVEVEAEDVAAAPVANGVGTHEVPNGVTLEVDVADDDDVVVDVVASTPVRPQIRSSPVSPLSPAVAAADVVSDTDSDSDTSSANEDDSESDSESETGSASNDDDDDDDDVPDPTVLSLSPDPTLLSPPPLASPRAFKRARTPDAPLDGTTPNAKRARNEPSIHGLAPRETPLPEGVSPWVAAALKRTHAELARVRAVTDTHRAAVALARQVLPASVWQVGSVPSGGEEEEEGSEEEGESGEEEESEASEW
ncbi:hypothetical protein GGF31_007898 [Allomyces arbusculus]|nr:hypothetical protein GGF31_007898 [Allomyces arbusculus]